MLIYPTAGSGAISSRMMNTSGGGGGPQKSGRAAARPGAVQRRAEATKTRSKQTVQWKLTDVEQGVVVVDEKQLMRLVKTEPIENYYRLESEPFAKWVFRQPLDCWIMFMLQFICTSISYFEQYYTQGGSQR